MVFFKEMSINYCPLCVASGVEAIALNQKVEEKQSKTKQKNKPTKQNPPKPQTIQKYLPSSVYSVIGGR